MKAIFILGSKSDQEFADKIAGDLIKDWDIHSEIIIASAHKVPRKVADIVERNNKSGEDLVYVTVAGRSNALSGVVAANSVHPVIACPPFKDKDDFIVNINSTLMMPSETPVLTVVDPANAALSVVRIFALIDPKLKKKVGDRIEEVRAKFEE